MSQVLIEFRPSSFYPPRSGPWIAGGITFVPGVKSYPLQDWESLSKHPNLAPTINGCIEEGILRVVSQSNSLRGAIEEVPPLPKNQVEAIALVKKTYSISLLTGWQKIENRKAVLEAIATQLKIDKPAINVPPPKEKEVLSNE